MHNGRPEYPRLSGLHYGARRIVDIERMDRSTKNGNPRWRLMFAGGEVSTTEDDINTAHMIGNPGIGIGDTVAVSYSENGKIRHVSDDLTGLAEA